MNIRKSLGMAATTVKANLFNRISTNPNRKDSSSTNYLDLIYERDYKTIRRYRDYREMMQDPQVKIGIQILQMFLLSREMHITATGENDIDKQATDALESFIKQDMDTPLRNVRKNIYTAIPYGFSAQELVYKLRDDGKIGLKGMYPIHRRTLDHADAFDFDDDGELVALNQSDVDVIGVNTPIPIEKTLLYSFDCEFDDPRGNSALDEVYDNYYIKKKILKWLAIFLQKHEGPTVVGKIDNDNKKMKMQEQLEQLAEGRTNITIGKEDDVSVLESSHRGEAFFNAITYHDNVIFRRLFIGTLIMGQDDASGAYSQSQTQVEVMRMLLDGVHEEIAGAMQKVLDQLTDWNFSQASKPKISFEKFEDKDVIALLAALQPYFKDMIIEKGKWLDEIIATAIKEYANIDVDLDEDSTEEGGEYYNPESIPGDENAPLNNTQIVNDLVSTLPVK
jgi:hypothetical protein